MPLDRLVMAFDTSAAHCAAALLSGDRIVAAQAEPMKKGQAERLFPILEDLLRTAGHGWRDIARIGVGTGPGNFTGIRIAVSAARGLALSLKCPVVGVSTFAAIHAGQPGRVAAVPAPREMAYTLAPGASEPDLVPMATVPDPALPPELDTWVAAIARIAAATDPATAPPPAPIYLRPADAAPPRDAPPEIVP
ncbi:protease, putative [Pseudooceanicola batsensis HTCC2597]|uniref:Protease, putative n=1 Tax=Pseudooceanicola batsensis (strain ATCC BAA-863 / DSM 15984 / KCTC 12145 / HTCC2597) TaxID=252305 RepID=A3TVE1_PSEBH|nr:tRNA (adenosine(37)-N6)-threonylcarbamoyltransferase complex dimerization subunit type 1 TsaB [Pseudooceanicola batsensis]EAQ04487.1 protease, putative [Pseudooceanicola batsensis HTCC2597]